MFQPIEEHEEDIDGDLLNVTGDSTHARDDDENNTAGNKRRKMSAEKKKMMLMSEVVDIMKTTITASAPAPAHTPEEGDEWRIFTNLIFTKAKKYSDRTRRAVQREINEILYKADDGVYDNYGNYSAYNNYGRMASNMNTAFQTGHNRCSETNSPASSILSVNTNLSNPYSPATQSNPPYSPSNPPYSTAIETDFPYSASNPPYSRATQSNPPYSPSNPPYPPVTECNLSSSTQP